MNLFLFVLFFFINHGASKQTFNGVEKITKRNYECIDILTEDIKTHHWPKDEKPCLDQILKTIINIKNSTLWATWIWDSNQLPVGQLMGSKHHLGNYDQCITEQIGSSSPPFRTKYCLTDIVLLSDKELKVLPQNIDPYGRTEEYINTKTEWNQHFNVITWGVCVPETCQKESVKKILRTVLGQSYLGRLKLQYDIKMENCELAGEAKSHIDGFNITMVAAFIMIGVVLSCTKYISEHQRVNSTLNNIIKCFCIKRNSTNFLARPKNDIKVLNGMRFMSSCAIVLAHSIMTCMLFSSGNTLDFEKYLNSYGKFILNLVIVVDTFFLMSGLLFIRSIKANSTLWDLLKMLIKRYFRLIWWYIAVQVTIIFILPRFGCGPLCSRYMDYEQGACLKTWWLGLLMMVNYIDRTNICHPPSWYISSDFQLTLLATLLFWIHQKHPRIGKICFSILACLSILLPGIAAYNTPELGDNPFHFQLYNVMRNVEDSKFFASYLQTHNRASPYLVGLMLGYVMNNYGVKGFRNNFTKKQLFVYVTPFIAAIVYLHTWSYNLQVMLYIVLHRIMWAFFNCGIIIMCEYGSLPYIKEFLSWSIFLPLSKLTYGIYMIHCVTIMYNSTSMRSPLHYNGYLLTEKFLGNLTLSCFISLFFLLFVEAPLNNLIKMLLDSIGNKELKKNIDKNTEATESSEDKNKDL
ncbi:PREDICTED: nose resistant to fluoxetine protein 6-like [Papilio polytes]|uniref:nose resistant to fluoxetine protein 6-like n=1 Tax=Papilio polytes TaxID=76194 RepID=UPI0006761DA8|nr:PREDICTED: nose resistant to fluoxetine protein 6-like [Papilio polytes]